MSTSSDPARDAAPSAAVQAPVNPLAGAFPGAIAVMPIDISPNALVPIEPADPSANLPANPSANLPGTSADPALDAHGYDPADYQWVPVRRKRRHDGWSDEKQRLFIETLADTGSVSAAARAVGMSMQSCYRLRRSPGAENFAAAWDAAIEQASKMLADIAFDRAINGVDDPVIDKDGHCIYVRTRYNDRLLMFLMRAHAPGRYRHAHRDQRLPGEVAPEPAPPVEATLTRMQPVTPPDPHLLMPPEELDIALQCADIMDGELPSWHRDLPEPGYHGPMLGQEHEDKLVAFLHPQPGDRLKQRPHWLDQYLDDDGEDDADDDDDDDRDEDEGEDEDAEDERDEDENEDVGDGRDDEDDLDEVDQVDEVDRRDSGHSEDRSGEDSSGG